VAQSVDYTQLALSSTRQAFVAAAPYAFIISDGTLARASGPQRTVPIDKVELGATQEHPSSDRQARVFIALPVRKSIETFPNMITVGRTANNDLVVPDVSISKFHAFFRDLGDSRGPRFDLTDAGSKNGTWVSGAPLAPRGEAAPVRLRDRIRFGRIEFTVVDAGVCWDTIDRMRR
jgi:pSer/pThr/pTyr-binding forkhead associated (FHA) protein